MILKKFSQDRKDINLIYMAETLVMGMHSIGLLTQKE